MDIADLLTRKSEHWALFCKPTTDIDDTSNQYIITLKGRENGAWANMYISVPRLEPGTNIFIQQGLYYAAVYHARAPIINWVDGKFTVKREHRGNIEFVWNNNTNSMQVIYPNDTIYPASDLSTIQRFCIAFLPEDRAHFNSITGSEKSSLFLTMDDIDIMSHILEENKKPLSNISNSPDHIDNLMVEDLERSVAHLFLEHLEMISMRAVQGGWFSQNLWNRIFKRWLYSDRFIQYIDYPEGISNIAWQHKIIIPESDEHIYNRPHPSWKGFIDVLSTPMSEKAGIVVSLADGAKVIDGKIVSSCESTYSPHLRRTLLFPGMIRGPRIVLLSNTIKQSCSLETLDGDNNNHTCRIVPTGTDHIPSPSGRYLQTAIMNFNGLTHEDACIVSSSTARQLTTTATMREIFSIPVKCTGRILPSVGDTVEVLDSVLYTIDPNGIEEITRSRKLRNPGKVIAIEKRTELINLDVITHYIITWVSEYRLGVGSKLCGLHANKHIVSAIIDDNQMPKLPSGRPIDIIISPYTIGERMSPSLLLEGMINLAMSTIDTTDNEELLEFTKDRILIEPFDQKWSFEYVSKCLEQMGQSPTAQSTLTYNKIGHSMEFVYKYKDVFCAPLFFMRLHQHPEDKLRYQNKQILNPAEMPIAGKGNVRLTREEAEVLIAVGASGLLSEFCTRIPTQVVSQLNNLTTAIGEENECQEL